MKGVMHACGRQVESCMPATVACAMQIASCSGTCGQPFSTRRFTLRLHAEAVTQRGQPHVLNQTLQRMNGPKPVAHCCNTTADEHIKF